MTTDIIWTVVQHTQRTRRMRMMNRRQLLLTALAVAIVCSALLTILICHSTHYNTIQYEMFLPSVLLKTTLNAKEFVSKTIDWVDISVRTPMVTNLENWKFTNRVDCQKFDLEIPFPNRQKVILDCKSTHPTIKTTDRTSHSDVYSVPFGDECLRNIIDNYCTDQGRAPNVAHYVWYKRKALGFFHFVSFMSVLRFMKPCLFLIHGDSLPYGPYWDYFIDTTPQVLLLNRTRPTSIFGQQLGYEEHGSDIMRIEAMMHYGGYYLDTDELLLRSLQPLMKYDYTQGKESPKLMGSQLIIAKRNATFLLHWYQGYRQYYPTLWTKNALLIPMEISKSKPELIHVEGFNFTKPNWEAKNEIFYKNYDWSTNYAMHLFLRAYHLDTDPLIIRQLNTTIGSVCRHILLGNKELCRN